MQFPRRGFQGFPPVNGGGCVCQITSRQIAPPPQLDFQGDFFSQIARDLAIDSPHRVWCWLDPLCRCVRRMEAVSTQHIFSMKSISILMKSISLYGIHHFLAFTNPNHTLVSRGASDRVLVCFSVRCGSEMVARHHSPGTAGENTYITSPPSLSLSLSLFPPLPPPSPTTT